MVQRAGERAGCPFGLAMILVLGAYDGWIEATYVGSELRNPAKDMARDGPLHHAGHPALCRCQPGSSVVLGQTATAQSTLVAADAMKVVMGPVGGALITVAILISTTGCSNGMIFSARIPYAMALEGRFFRWAAARSGPPIAEPGQVQGLGLGDGVLRDLQPAADLRGVRRLFYALSCAAVMVRHREPAMPRPYRTWATRSRRWCSSCFQGISILNTIVNAPRDAAIGGGSLALGLPVHVVQEEYSTVSRER